MSDTETQTTMDAPSTDIVETETASSNSTVSDTPTTLTPPSDTPNNAICPIIPQTPIFNIGRTVRAPAFPSQNRPAKDFESLLSPTKFEFKCIYPECDFKCELTNDLYIHIRGHGKAIECPHCGIKRSSLSVMVNHVRSHSGERPYQCPLPHCDQAFSTKGIMRQHMVSRRHRNVMSLDLINDILSWDTKHGRPQRKLRGPRERVHAVEQRSEAQFAAIKARKDHKRAMSMMSGVPAQMPLQYMAADPYASSAMLTNPYAAYHQSPYSASSIRNSPMSPMMFMYPNTATAAWPTPDIAQYQMK